MIGIDSTHDEFSHHLYIARVVDWSGPIDEHGTKVASVAVGNTLGVTYDARIRLYDAQLCEDDWGDCPFSQMELAFERVLQAIDTMVGSRRFVINMSWFVELSNRRYDTLDEYLAAFTSRGGILVYGAANEGRNACGSDDRFPQATSRGINVGAFDPRTGDIWSGSNYGSCVDVYAPGRQVEVATFNDGTELSSGTSLASPIVAGIVIQMLSMDDGISTFEVTSSFPIDVNLV